jgi:hypothetical protein
MKVRLLFITATIAIACWTGWAQQQEAPLTGFKDATAPLFFRETWKHDYSGPTEGPISQKHVDNSNLELKLYGDQGGRNPDSGIWENQTGPNDPPHSYTGTCRKPCALALKHRTSFVDLTGNAKLKWRTRISRLRHLHPIIKLADGRWLVGDYAETFRSAGDYVETEISFADIKWLLLDINQVLLDGNNNWVENVNLSRVDEIGFTDLAPGSASSHGAAARSNVDWIEVYGKPVPRN